MLHGARRPRWLTRTGSTTRSKARSAIAGIALSAAVAAAIAISVVTPGTARANGRYPLASQLVVDPLDPDHLVARTTFGVLSSADAGATWRWVCEEALGALEIAED